jgi:putative PIN family toxin of toxin-antitoxin system
MWWHIRYTVIRAVIDTNVLVAALRSSTGASHEILLAADRGDFEVALSVPLLAEYDDVCHRPNSGIPIPAWAVDDLIHRIAQISRQQTIHYLWRGILPDPKDDMVLEVAVAAGVSHIITFNHRHLKQASEFGIAVVTPSEFLIIL